MVLRFSVLSTMLHRYAEIAATVYDPDRGSSTEELDKVCGAYNAYGGFVGPWLE